VNIEGLSLPASPPFFKLHWREIALRRVVALAHVDVVEEPAQLADGISIALIVRQVNFLLFDGAHESFGVTVLPGFTPLGHANLCIDGLGAGERQCLFGRLRAIKR
jgi:hypothetical protein